MNTQIKFRGKRIGGTEWIYGDLNHIGGKVFIFDRSENAPLNSPDWFEVDPETVGQYIGFKNKLNQEIYVGQQLYNPITDSRCIVKFKNGMFYGERTDCVTRNDVHPSSLRYFEIANQ